MFYFGDGGSIAYLELCTLLPFFLLCICTNNGLFLIWVIVWIVLSYCFWHISQLSVSQSHLISVLIQMNCFHFPFLRCSRARLLKTFLLLLNILLYCLSTLGVVISFMLKSALLITEHDLPDHSCPRVARRPCMPTSIEMLVKRQICRPSHIVIHAKV